MTFRPVLGYRHALLVASLTLPWSSGCRTGFSGDEGSPDGAVTPTGLDGSGGGASDSADTAQGSWVTDKVAFQPTAVMLVQFQIPSSTAAPVPWDFCVQGMTAITQ